MPLASGYSLSKWVAERVCVTTHVQVTNTDWKRRNRKLVISVIGAGHLCGNNKSGFRHAREVYPLKPLTAKLTYLRELPEGRLNWVTADVATRPGSNLACLISWQPRDRREARVCRSTYITFSSTIRLHGARYFEWISNVHRDNPVRDCFHANMDGTTWTSDND
ncbi:hypothetical protein GGR50DRAFT_518791 [Xylaria sp. CBS 124048]|nr:hypothetical protein GGR50DRAFT_518791 [Xylaria sp. CBS 124048]